MKPKIITKEIQVEELGLTNSPQEVIDLILSQPIYREERELSVQDLIQEVSEGLSDNETGLLVVLELMRYPEQMTLNDEGLKVNTRPLPRFNKLGEEEWGHIQGYYVDSLSIRYEETTITKQPLLRLECSETIFYHFSDPFLEGSPNPCTLLKQEKALGNAVVLFARLLLSIRRGDTSLTIWGGVPYHYEMTKEIELDISSLKNPKALELIGNLYAHYLRLYLGNDVEEEPGVPVDPEEEEDNEVDEEDEVSELEDP